jgi:hypothetical protein
VPEGARGPQGERLHDDLLLADSLVAQLDRLEWHVSLPGFIIPGKDPLDDMDGRF